MKEKIKTLIIILFGIICIALIVFAMISSIFDCVNGFKEMISTKFGCFSLGVLVCFTIYGFYRILR